MFSKDALAPRRKAQNEELIGALQKNDQELKYDDASRIATAWWETRYPYGENTHEIRWKRFIKKVVMNKEYPEYLIEPKVSFLNDLLLAKNMLGGGKRRRKCKSKTRKYKKSRKNRTKYH